MKESVFQTKVLDYLKSVGAWCFTTHGGSQFQVAGLPDVLACYKGVFLGFELKTGNYQPTPLQLSKLNRIQLAGGVGMVIRDRLDDIIDVLDFIDFCGHAPTQVPYIIKSEVIIDE